MTCEVSRMKYSRVFSSFMTDPTNNQKRYQPFSVLSIYMYPDFDRDVKLLIYLLMVA